MGAGSRETEKDSSRRKEDGQEFTQVASKIVQSKEAANGEGNGGPVLARGKQASHDVCHKQENRDTIIGEDKREVGEGGAQDRGNEDGQRPGKASFVCSVVPLSLALDRLGVGVVDLLKVDVEGDELTVLRGISADDWPKIQQASKRRPEQSFYAVAVRPRLLNRFLEWHGADTIPASSRLRVVLWRYPLPNTHVANNLAN